MQNNKLPSEIILFGRRIKIEIVEAFEDDPQCMGMSFFW